jgi:hypothetical protein
MITSAALRAIASLILLMSLTSCVPVPHAVHLRPPVKGIVLEDEKPIPGVELYLSKSPGNNEPCTDPGEVISVAKNGSFSWAPVQEYALTDSLINPVGVRASLVVLCIRHPTMGALIGAMLFVNQNEIGSLRLVCDVRHPHRHGSGPDTTSTMLGQAQYCETQKLDDGPK